MHQKSCLPVQASKECIAVTELCIAIPRKDSPGSHLFVGVGSSPEVEKLPVRECSAVYKTLKFISSQLFGAATCNKFSRDRAT